MFIHCDDINLGGDQGLLNEFFSDWKENSHRRLPFIYNVTPNAGGSGTYVPAYHRLVFRVR
jgi:hypothetical protein